MKIATLVAGSLLALSACDATSDLENSYGDDVMPMPSLPSMTVWRAVPTFKQDVAVNTVAYADGCAIKRDDLGGNCQNLFGMLAQGGLPDALKSQFESPARYDWCFNDPARRLMGVTDTPALFGDSTQFDSRSYECYRDEDGQQAFVKYADLEGDARAQDLADHPELLPIDPGNRNCQKDGQGPDGACLDRCVVQGHERLEKGFAYQTDLCFPIFGVVADAWEAQYLCNNHAPQPGDPFAAFYRPGNEFATTYTPADPQEPGYGHGLYGFLPLDPTVSQDFAGEFSACSNYVFPHYDLNDGKLYAPEIGFVAGLDRDWASAHFVPAEAGGDEGRDPVAYFVLQKVEGTNQAIHHTGGVFFKERLIPGYVTKNLVRNSQGFVAATTADGATHWCREDSIGDASNQVVGCWNAATFRPYGKQGGPFVLVARENGSDKLGAGEYVNNEAPSYFDAIQVIGGPRYDYLNQRARLIKPR